MQGLEGLSKPGGPLSHFDRTVPCASAGGREQRLGFWIYLFPGLSVLPRQLGTGSLTGPSFSTVGSGEWAHLLYHPKPVFVTKGIYFYLAVSCDWVLLTLNLSVIQFLQSLYYLNIGSWALRLDLDLYLVPMATLVVAVSFPVISKHVTSGSSTSSSSSSSLFRLFICMCMSVCVHLCVCTTCVWRQ